MEKYFASFPPRQPAASATLAAGWRGSAMDNFLPQYGKPEGTLPPARSATPIYERETPRQAL